MLAKLKLALRIATDVYDTELQLLINAALKDLELPGVKEYETEEDIPVLVQIAVITYCKMHFGEPDNYDKLEKSYNEQKSQLITSHIYNDRGWTE